MRQTAKQHSKFPQTSAASAACWHEKANNRIWLSPLVQVRSTLSVVLKLTCKCNGKVHSIQAAFDATQRKFARYLLIRSVAREPIFRQMCVNLYVFVTIYLLVMNFCLCCYVNLAKCVCCVHAQTHMRFHIRNHCCCLRI